MAVSYPAFPERVFEFAFNAEYCHVNHAVLIGTPELPTQNEEKYLGYDVAFEIQKAGGAVNTIALQHKISRFVTARSGSNARFYDEVGGPYFATRLDTEQFNIIEDLASAHMPGVQILYCMPLFTTRNDIDTHYVSRTVLTHSVWIDVAGVGQLPAHETHTMVCPPGVGPVHVFSERGRLAKRIMPHRREKSEPNRRRLQPEDFRESFQIAYDRIVERRQDLKPDRRFAFPKDVEVGQHPEGLPMRDVSLQYLKSEAVDKPLQALRDLICVYAGMSMLVELPNGEGHEHKLF